MPAGDGAVLYVTEPASAYARRPRLVVDATVMAAQVFGEATAGVARASVEAWGLNAPHLIDLEMASVGLKKIRREGKAAARVREALEGFAALPVDRHAIDPRAVLDLAQRYALSAYDAAYLWLAERLEAPLATFDAELAEAARRHLAGPATDA